MSGPGNKSIDIGLVMPGLPSLAAWLPRSVLATGSVGIHPNEVAGTLVLLAPLSLRLSLARSAGRGLRAMAAIACAASLVVLVVTRSRSGWAGFAAACLVLAAASQLRGQLGWDPRRLFALAGALACSLGLAVALGGPLVILEWLEPPAGETSSGVSRLELWRRVCQMLQDFPFTGTGLNTFPFVLDTFYPTLLSSTGELVAHAHNVYLQVAVDLGIPGLLAFLGLLLGAARSWYRGRGVASLSAALADGAALGVLGFCVYGLTDAIALGARPSILFWLLLGTIARVEREARVGGGPTRTGTRL